MKTLKLILAICLICGFSIGSGFLTLTATVGLSGFWGGFVSVILIWLLGIASGALYLEAFLAVPEALHLVSLCKRVAGPVHTIAVSIVYLFFSYSTLIVCYIFMYDLFDVINIQHRLPTVLGADIGVLVCTLLFAGLILWGHLPTLSVIACIFLIFLGSLSYDIYIGQSLSLPQLGAQTHIIFIMFSIGAIFNVSFYQSILPTLVSFLNRNRQALLYSIWIGFTLAMFILLVWLWMTLRPETYGSFLAAFESDSTFTESFLILKNLPPLQVIFHFLAIFGVMISFLSIAISLRDFFEDVAMHFFKNNNLKKRLFFIILIFLPAWVFSLIVTNRFVTFNTFASAFCEYFLSTFFPLQWVWAIRYRLALPIKPVLFGGKPMMVFMIIVTAILFFIIGVMPINAIY